MKKSETKSFILGMLTMALILITFIVITAISVNESSNGSKIAYAYDDAITTTTTTTTSTTTGQPTRPDTSTSIGIYNGIIQYSNQYNSGTVVVTILECNSNVSGEIEIPETINGLTVADIRISAFSKCESLDSIILPESIKEIRYSDYNNKALFNSNLKKLTIKNPECEIYFHWDTIPESTIIYGYADSTAQQYAQTFNREFIILDGQPSETTPPATTPTAPTTTTHARKFGDINGDGLVDANDASTILAYYSYASTGGTADLEEYLGL